MSPIKTLFIHHSTGANIIREGDLRKRLKDLNPTIELWDHSYNLDRSLPRFLTSFTHRTGLSDESGHMTGTDYDIILSNNSPKDYAEIFSRSSKDATLKAILTYDIVAFKNCYPTTKIVSGVQLHEFQNYYRIIRDALGQYKKKKFVVITPPPLRKELTQPDFAARAQKLAAWLQSKEFITTYKNISVFDLFGLLADENGYLKKEYCRAIPFDSHPNTLANQTVAGIFARHLSKISQ